MINDCIKLTAQNNIFMRLCVIFFKSATISTKHKVNYLFCLFSFKLHTPKVHYLDKWSQLCNSYPCSCQFYKLFQKILALIFYCDEYYCKSTTVNNTDDENFLKFMVKEKFVYLFYISCTCTCTHEQNPPDVWDPRPKHVSTKWS